MFVFQGAAKLEPSGTSANVRACERIAKQGFGQLLAFEISLGRTPLLEWLKCWQMSWLCFFNGIISLIYFSLQVDELKTQVLHFLRFIFHMCRRIQDVGSKESMCRLVSGCHYFGSHPCSETLLLHFSVVAKQMKGCPADVGAPLFDQLYHFN